MSQIMHHNNLNLDFTTPLIFTDATDYWNKVTEEYVVHQKGFFILGPSGVEKTHFIKNQTGSHWIVGDKIRASTNASPAGE